MDRNEILRLGLSKDKVGLEVGPLHNSICPKRDGWRVLTIDVCPTDELKSKFHKNPNIDASLIEDVDILYSESLSKSLINYGLRFNQSFAEAANCVEYIISSHYFEHQPNPIQFLIDCQNALRDGGILNMAIPIGSRCFDCWKQLTTIGEWIDAYYEKRGNPSYGKILDSRMNTCILPSGQSINEKTYSIKEVIFKNTMTREYMEFIRQERERTYVDAHCSILNPYSFQLLFEDTVSLGLLNSLSIRDVKVKGFEFIVSIVKSEAESMSAEEMTRRRRSLAIKSMKFHFKDIKKPRSKRRSLAESSQPSDRLPDLDQETSLLLLGSSLVNILVRLAIPVSALVILRHHLISLISL